MAANFSVRLDHTPETGEGEPESWGFTLTFKAQGYQDPKTALEAAGPLIDAAGEIDGGDGWQQLSLFGGAKRTASRGVRITKGDLPSFDMDAGNA